MCVSKVLCFKVKKIVLRAFGLTSIVAYSKPINGLLETIMLRSSLIYSFPLAE